MFYEVEAVVEATRGRLRAFRSQCRPKRPTRGFLQWTNWHSESPEGHLASTSVVKGLGF